ncbi:hypothetical protein RND81_05G033200 [Saponaria officinalis]|uniref:RING-type E3 ubiquitin transferase n=1 Tax=Saponaria officinalis TaxID=3572 RepID=A0AAW1KUC9_SAPOF
MPRRLTFDEMPETDEEEEEEEDEDGDENEEEEDEEEEEDDSDDELFIEDGGEESVAAVDMVFEVPNSDMATTSTTYNAAAAVEEDEGSEWNREEIDGLFCPICMEPWSSSGEHLPSCLSCGHMFGMSCIKKWLGQCRSSAKAGKCPQCNKKCTLKDVRRIYGSRVVVVDEESQKRIRFLEAKCSSLEKQDEEWRKKEIEWRMKMLVWQKKEACWREKYEDLNKRTSNLERSVEELGKKSSRPIAALQCSSGSKLGLNHSPDLASSFELKQDLLLDGARYFDVDHLGQILVIARRPTQLGGPHILTKMSLASPYEQDDVLLPSTVRSVRDVHVSPSGRFALLASMGKKLSVVSLESNNIVVNYDLPVAAWSCSWDINDSNYVYTGLQNGMVLVFDLRQTDRPLETRIGLTSNPVHTIYSLLENSAVPSGTKNLLTASSVGLCRWDLGVVPELPTLIDETANQGVCISLAYCQNSDNIVATFRPKMEMPDDNGISQVSQTQSHNMGQNVLGSHVLFKRLNSRYHNFGSIYSYVPGIRLPKSTILGIGDDTSLFACGDDSTCNLALLELPSLTVTHCLQSNHPVRDVKYATSVNPNLLCCLSEDRVQLYCHKHQ